MKITKKKGYLANLQKFKEKTLKMKALHIRMSHTWTMESYHQKNKYCSHMI